MLTSQEMATRLRDRMGESKYEELKERIEKDISQSLENGELVSEVYNNLYHKYAYPQLRQFGSKVQIKERTLACDLNLKRFNSSHPLWKELLSDMLKKDHEFIKLSYEVQWDKITTYGKDIKVLYVFNDYSLWINGQIYHWSPISKNMYGDSETDKEITNEWNISPEFDKVYFTLHTHNEITEFCDKWQKENKFDVDTNNCLTFAKKLMSFMEIEDLSSE